MKRKTEDIKKRIRKNNSSPVCYLEGPEIQADYKLPEPPEKRKNDTPKKPSEVLTII